MELQNKVKSYEEQLQKANEMNQEFVELKFEHWITTENLRIKSEQLQHTQTENQRLKQENDKLQKQLGNSLQPNYEALRSRTLNKLKVGSQSAAGKAIDAFIRELKRE